MKVVDLWRLGIWRYYGEAPLPLCFVAVDVGYRYLDCVYSSGEGLCWRVGDLAGCYGGVCSYIYAVDVDLN